MGRRLRSFLVTLLSVVVALVTLIAIFGPFLARRSFPQIEGEVRLSGLESAVEIYRDPFGIPHIYAASTHDLFFAQGYVHAQDRFWQMDVWRHTGNGTLSRMFGKDQVDTDKFLRTLGWGRLAQQEWSAMDSDQRAILQAYADGVNAYLEEHGGSALSLEYTILKIVNPSYAPEPWEPVHTITWAKVMAWDLRGNMEEELERAHLLKTFSMAQVDELFPTYQANMPLIIPNWSGETSQVGSSDLAHSPRLLAALETQLTAIQTQARSLDALRGEYRAGLGSNSWVISGARTTSGKPLLANDPHLSIQMPSIWYEIGLHCSPVGAACPFEVTGFSFAGAPAVIIGHNQRIAWGFTNVGPDVMDLYIERLNPDNPNQYEVNGQWVDMQLVQETIDLGDGKSEPFTVRYTRHGPVLSDVSESLGKLRDESGLPIPEQYAIALRWTALEPAYLFRAIVGFNLAQNWDEFRTAARDFAVPSQNLVYADVDGNIAYQMPGNIPIRAGGDGRMPVPGWTDEYEWTGYIPFDELPSLLNPVQGYIATANNAVIGPDYPYLITADWDYGYRAVRITELIGGATALFSLESLQKIQGDNLDMSAPFLLPVILQLPPGSARMESTRGLLLDWDGQTHMDSAPAALFEAFRKHLLALTFQDDLPEDSWFSGGSRSATILERLVSDPNSPWWDNRATAETETRDQIFQQALEQAYAELAQRLGSDPGKWSWGDLHMANFRNPTLGESGIAPIEAIFNRSGFRASGGGLMINATAWDASGDSYEVESLPSMRMLVDLSNLAGSLSVHTTGQSGHAYHPHYTDMADLWRNIQYHPMLWERAQVEKVAEGYLRLAP